MVWAVAAIHTTCSEKTADRFKNIHSLSIRERLNEEEEAASSSSSSREKKTSPTTTTTFARSVKMLVECGASLFVSNRCLTVYG